MLRILIVEDDLLIAKDLERYLVDYDCEIVEICANGDDAMRVFSTKRPDFVFIDIELQTKTTGIDVARYINKTSRVPFVYLTDYFGSQSRYFKAANNTRPANYLPKGTYLPAQLWHFVETAMHQFDVQDNGLDGTSNSAILIHHHFFVRDLQERQWQKLLLDDLLYVEVVKPYCKVFVRKHKATHYLIRKTLNDLMDKLAVTPLVRIHQSIAVNSQKVEQYDETFSMVTLDNGISLRVGKTFKKVLAHTLPLID